MPCPCNTAALSVIIPAALLLPRTAMLTAWKVLLPMYHDAHLPCWYPYVKCPSPCHQLNLTLELRNNCIHAQGWLDHP
jgi:hypothetical protein